MTLPTNKASEMAELKACPFCGGEAKLFQDVIYTTGEPNPNGWFVRCDPCDLIRDQAWGCSSAAEAITAWNTRAPPVTREAVEALEAVARVLLPIDMTLAQGECVDEPMADSGVLLSFMGSGASDHVTAGEYRAARQKVDAAIRALKSEPVVDQEGEAAK